MFNIFPYVFTNTFNTLVNDTDLIDNIVNSVLNSDFMNNMINTFEDMVKPNIEFKEYNRAYVLLAELPGVDKSNITLDYDNNYITLRVNRNVIYSNKGNVTMAVIQSNNNIVKDYYVEDIDPFKIKAIFNEGRLRVTIPKKTINTDNSATIIDVYDYSD